MFGKLKRTQNDNTNCCSESEPLKAMYPAMISIKERMSSECKTIAECSVPLSTSKSLFGEEDIANEYGSTVKQTESISLLTRPSRIVSYSPLGAPNLACDRLELFSQEESSESLYDAQKKSTRRNESYRDCNYLSGDEPTSVLDTTENLRNRRQETNTRDNTSILGFPEQPLTRQEPSSRESLTSTIAMDVTSRTSSRWNTRKERSSKNSKCSLFGLVMKNIADPKTPTKALSTTGVRESPGGSQLLRLLNNDLTSPFQINRNKEKHKLQSDTIEVQHPPSSTTPIPIQSTTPRTVKRSNRLSTQKNNGTQRENVEWHECLLHLKNFNNKGHGIVMSENVGVVDWSIKSKVQVNCHPFMPFLSENETCATGSLQQTEAISHFNCHSSALLTKSPITHYTLSARFHSGLLYWQHPASPQQQQLRGEYVYQSKKHSINGEPNQGIVTTQSNLKCSHDIHRSRTSSAIDTQQGDCDFKNNTENQSQEWQQSFRSVYLNWIHRIQCLQKLLNDQLQCCDKQYKDDLQGNCPIVKSVLDTYFYVVNDDEHTILFRVGMPLSFVQDTSQKIRENRRKNIVPQFVPEIVISASTKAMRAQLRNSGIGLMLMEQWDLCDDENDTNDANSEPEHSTMLFTEDIESKMFGPSNHEACKHKQRSETYTESLNDSHKQTIESSQSNPESSPQKIQSELVALRRAQLLGSTLGAEVSICTKKRKSGYSAPLFPRRRSSNAAPPLIITGMDNCAKFVEIYLNTVAGFNITSNFQKVETVTANGGSCGVKSLPLILCRKLGPFLNSSLKRVQLSFKKKQLMSSKSSKSLPERMIPSISRGSESMELFGRILPFAVRDITQVAIQSLIDDHSEERLYEVASEMENEFFPLYSSKKFSGSHHFVLKTTLYEQSGHPYSTNSGKYNGSISLMGSPTSKFFNCSLHAQFLGKLQLLLRENARMNHSNGAEDANVEDRMDQHHLTCCPCLTEEMLNIVAWDITQPSTLAFNLDRVEMK